MHYNYAFDNPIRFIDPDRMEPDWIPRLHNDKLVLQKENGDNVQTLAKFLGVDQKTADKEYENTSKYGLLRLSDNIAGVKEINSSIDESISNPDNYNNSAAAFFKSHYIDNTNYNSFECAISISSGNTPAFSNVMKTGEFNSMINSDFSNISSEPAKFSFGKTIATFSTVKVDIFGPNEDMTQHGAIYLGKSQNEAVHTWSKNGMFSTPSVQTISDLKEEYGNKVKYYNSK